MRQDVNGSIRSDGFRSTLIGVLIYMLRPDPGSPYQGRTHPSGKPAGEIRPGIIISDPKLVRGLNEIAGEIDKKIEVYSGNRDPAKNAKIGGAKNSAHTLGKGADVRIPGLTKPETAKIIFESKARVEPGIRQIYHLPDNGKLPEHTHLDTMPGPDLQQNPGGKYAPLSVFKKSRDYLNGRTIRGRTCMCCLPI